MSLAIIRLLGVLLFVAACRPDWADHLAPTTEGMEPRLTLEPEPGADTARARIAHAPDDEPVLVAGSLGDRQLRDLAAGEPSDAVLERILPVTIYADGPDRVVAPQAIFPPGRYTFALPEAGLTLELEVGTDAERALRRVFPPPDTPSDNGHFVLCGLDDPARAERITLLPDGPSGALRPLGDTCALFVPDEVRPGSFVPPLRALGRLLDPAPLVIAESTSEAAPPALCLAPELPIGRGCVFVDDDRLLLRGPDEPVLWALSLDGAGAAVAVTDGTVPLLIHGLAPASALALEVVEVGLRGEIGRVALSVHTRPAHPHLAISEVYANPVGPEPDQEWIELFNSGVVPAPLGGVSLRDLGGEIALPADATIAPGGFALLVGEAFDETPAWDVAPPTGAAIVRVPELGTNGLANGGEPLELIDADGRTLDRFPPRPKPKAGSSVGRRDPWVLPEDADGFVRFETPTPGAPNVVPPDDAE